MAQKKSNLRRRRGGGNDEKVSFSEDRTSSIGADGPGTNASSDSATQSEAKSSSDGEESPSAVKALVYQLFSRYRLLEGWTPNIVTAFSVLLFVRLISAAVTGFADCDETFNYWEPLHYMVYGYGMQTWEYSPEFALRSYAYLAPYALISKLLGRTATMYDFATRLVSFYAVRGAQGMASAFADTYLYDATVWRFGKPAARLLLVFLAACPGTFRASVELLPSSFAMICFSFCLGSWMVGEFGQAIFLVALAAIIGWPFAAVLGVPIALHVVLRRGVVFFTRASVLSGVGLFLYSLAIDSVYYGQAAFPALKLLSYNVFPVEGAGSHLYGEEEWTYYAANLLLNLNLVAAGLAVYPLMWMVDTSIAPVWAGTKESLKRAIYLSPPWLWLIIFFSQPHKEERFLAPIYTSLLLVAAVTIDDFLRLLCNMPVVLSGADMPSTAQTRKQGSVASRFFYCFLTIFATASFATLSVSRTIAVVKNYGAPKEIFTAFSKVELQNGRGPRNAPAVFMDDDTEVNICIGKEWHRFPSHYFLPGRRFRVHFTRSSFRGMLPKYFHEGANGTSVVPSGMNMFNKEDPAQYIDRPSKSCHYFVDLQLPNDNPLENPIANKDRMVVTEENFVDKQRSPSLYRSFYVPGLSDEKLKYGSYVIIRNLALLPIVHHQAYAP